MYFIPSVYAHIVGGGLFLGGVVYLAMYFSKLMIKDPYKILVLILLFSITMSVHGISHMGLEIIYGYNPLKLITGKTIEGYHPIDCPYRKNCNCPFAKDQNV